MERTKPFKKTRTVRIMVSLTEEEALAIQQLIAKSKVLGWEATSAGYLYTYVIKPHLDAFAEEEMEQVQKILGYEV